MMRCGVEYSSGHLRPGSSLAYPPLLSSPLLNSEPLLLLLVHLPPTLVKTGTHGPGTTRGVYIVKLVAFAVLFWFFLLLPLFESLRGFNVIYKRDYCFGV